MKTNQKIRILRIFLLLILFTGVLSACGDSDSDKEKESDKKATIGIVNQLAVYETMISDYKTAMAEQGYIEDETVTYLYNGPIGNLDDLKVEVQRLIDAKVDLIVTAGTNPTLTTQSVTAESGTPVVFLSVTDPVASGIVEDVTHPGGNVTGIMIGQSGSKRMEWLYKVVPTLTRIFVPYNSDDPGPSNTVKQVSVAAEGLGLEAVMVETPNREAMLDALENMPEDIDGILLIPDGFVQTQFEDILAFSLERKIPMATGDADQAREGAFLSLGLDALETGRQAARLSHQVLKGTPVGDLPIEVAETYLTINLKTAEEMGITIPDPILSLADELVR